MPCTIALDLGSSAVKTGVVDGAGRFSLVASRPSPRLTGRGAARECDARDYLETAEALLAPLSRDHPGAALAVACQRSSCLLWDHRTGRPVTPLISWQDRRAEAWCRARADRHDEWYRRTGLVTSPHYAGPTLAHLLETVPALRAGMDSGRLLFGTLEAFLIWHWTHGEVHRTDPSMAARSQLVALEQTDAEDWRWDPDLLDAFGIPERGLPRIGPSRTDGIDCRYGPLRVSVADQIAALASLPGHPGQAFVNLGTGGFVLRPSIGPPPTGGRGLLSSRLPGLGLGPWILEGTINAIGPLPSSAPIDGMGPDPCPEAYCLPDGAGIGAPHWRSGIGPVYSADSDPACRYRARIEGIVFRVCEILEALAGGTDDGPDGAAAGIGRLVVAGGLTGHEPALAPALAACSGLEVVVLDEPEATLLGAAGLVPGHPRPPARMQAVTRRGWDGLPEKYRRWREWVATTLQAPERAR